MINIDISKLASEIGEPTARFVESAEEKRQKMAIFGFAGGFLALFFLGFFIFIFINKSASANLSDLQGQIDVLEMQNNSLLQVERHATTIAQRNQNALSILTNNPVWSQAFTELEKITPKGIVFNRFEVENKDSLRMTGSSPDYQTVSRFMVSLGSSQFFKNVTLNSSSLTTRDESPIVEFSITFGVSPDLTKKRSNPLIDAQNVNPVPVEAGEEIAPVPSQSPEEPLEPSSPDSDTGNSLPVL